MQYPALVAFALALPAAAGAQETLVIPPDAGVPAVVDLADGIAVEVQRAHPGHMDHDELLKAIRQIVREELQRALGETRAQRVRREVQRSLRRTPGRWSDTPRRAGTFRWVPEGNTDGRYFGLEQGKAPRTFKEYAEREHRERAEKHGHDGHDGEHKERKVVWMSSVDPKQLHVKPDTLLFGHYDEKSDRVFHIDPIEVKATATKKKKATAKKAVKSKATATKKVEPAPLRIQWDLNTMRPSKMRPAQSKEIEAEIRTLEAELQELKRALEKRRKELRKDAAKPVRYYNVQTQPTSGRKVDVIEVLPNKTRVIDAKGCPVEKARVRLIAPDKSVHVRKARSV